MQDGNITGRVSGQQQCVYMRFRCTMSISLEDRLWNISSTPFNHCLDDLDASFPCRLEGRWPKSDLKIIDVGRWIPRWIPRLARHSRQVRKDSHGTRASVAMFPEKNIFTQFISYVYCWNRWLIQIHLSRARASRKDSRGLSMLHLCLGSNFHDSPNLAFWLGFGLIHRFLLEPPVERII